MNFIKKLAGRLLGNTLQFAFRTGAWLWPDDNKDTYIDRGYKDIPNLYAIISLIIQKSSIVPFETYRVKNKSKYAKYKAAIESAQTPKDYARAIVLKSQALDRIEGSGIEELLLKPNDYQTTEQLFEQLDGYKLLTGNSYLWAWTPGVGRDAAKPIQLHVPPSTMVTVITGSIAEPVRAYKLEYLADPIENSDMCHFKTWNPLASHNNIEDGIYGMSPLVSCRRLMQKYRDADISQGAMFKNMAPAGLLTGEKEANISEPQATAIKDRFKQLYGGVDKAGEIIVTSANMKWTQIGFSPVDLNTIEAKEEMLGELCNVYHMPIGMFTKVNSTENNMKESRKMMITDAVIPLVESRKGQLNRWLAPKFGDDIVLEFDYTVFGEISEELELLVKTAKEMYWINPNEKRALTNYDKSPDPNMEKYYFPSNLVTLDSLNTEQIDFDPDPLIDLENSDNEQEDVDDLNN